MAWRVFSEGSFTLRPGGGDYNVAEELMAATLKMGTIAGMIFMQWNMHHKRDLLNVNVTMPIGLENGSRLCIPLPKSDSRESLFDTMSLLKLGSHKVIDVRLHDRISGEKCVELHSGRQEWVLRSSAGESSNQNIDVTELKAQNRD